MTTPAASARPRTAIHLAPWRPVEVDDLVRLGRDEDGGYVVSARSIAAARTIVGLGINDDWSFEADVVRRHPGIEVVGVDGSVSPSIFRARARRAWWTAAGHVVRLQRWYAGEALRDGRHWRDIATRFTRFWTAPSRTFVQRFVGAGPAMLAWDDVLSRVQLSDEPDLFVKMDVEGAEYDLLPDMMRGARHIAGMVVELHECGDRWDDFAAAMDAFAPSFAIVHLHGNNSSPLIPGTDVPLVMEVTVVNRALLPAVLAPSTASYPRAGLDRPNDRGRPDHPLALSAERSARR